MRVNGGAKEKAAEVALLKCELTTLITFCDSSELWTSKCGLLLMMLSLVLSLPGACLCLSVPPLLSPVGMYPLNSKGFHETCNQEGNGQWQLVPS